MEKKKKNPEGGVGVGFRESGIPERRKKSHVHTSFILISFWGGGGMGGGWRSGIWEEENTQFELCFHLSSLVCLDSENRREKWCRRKSHSWSATLQTWQWIQTFLNPKQIQQHVIWCHKHNLLLFCVVRIVSGQPHMNKAGLHVTSPFHHQVTVMSKRKFIHV